MALPTSRPVSRNCRLLLALALVANTAGPALPVAAERLTDPAAQATPPTATPTSTPTPAVATPEGPTGTPSPEVTSAATPTETPTSTVEPSVTPTPAATLTETPTALPPVMIGDEGGLEGLQFGFAVSPASAAPGDLVTYTVTLTNAGPLVVSGLVFTDDVPPGLAFQPAVGGAVTLDRRAGRLTAALSPLAPGETVRLRYALRLQGPGRFPETLLVNAAGVAHPASGGSLVASAHLLIAAPGRGGGLVRAGGGLARSADNRVGVHVPPGALAGDRVVLVEPEGAPRADGYSVRLGVRRVAGGHALGPADAEVELVPAEASFAQPVTLEFSLDGLADLASLPADRAAYVVTRDEASGAWLRVPLAGLDPATNSVLVQTDHFSSWGAGVGPAFPADGAGVLLFDQARPDLFTGRARFSLPIWTPPGPGGLSPDLALAYSSGTADGVLRDVQAPWTGWGWALSTVEIAREITNGACGPCGEGSYGYADHFVLLYAGTGYPLVDSGDGRRYHTQDQTFLYVERHNAALGNQGATTNTTKEWWEVVARDGTAYRLGYNLDSEQLASMKGYPGAATGAWASLGYAGAATNRVAARWRVDQISDTSNNTITFAYDETPRAIAGTTDTYDRASYLRTVSYSGYSVEFVREGRGAEDMPATGDLQGWSVWDDDRLDRVDVKYGAGVVRSYDLAHATRSYADDGKSWQTTVLSGVAVSGGTTVAPTIAFAYADKDNRAACGAGCQEWAYPRLESIANGYGGALAYEYESDGRTDASGWYSWRVGASTITSGVAGVPAMKTAFAYAGVKYAGGYTATYHYTPPSGGWWSNDHHDSPSEFGPWPGCYPANPSPGDNCTYPSLQPGNQEHVDHGHVYSAHYVGGTPASEYWSYAADEAAGELLGYATVTETILDSDGVTALSRTVHNFHTRDALPALPDTTSYQEPQVPYPARAGREYQTQDQDAASVVLRQVDTTVADFATDYNGGAPGGDVHFVYAARVDSSLRSGGSLSLVARTDYTHENATGNLLTVKEYDGANLATPYRQTEHAYLAETANHIAGRLRSTTLRDGAGGVLSRTYFAYDGTPAGIGARGLLTLVQGVERFSPGERTADTAYEHDAYGNRIRARAYTAYGAPGTLPSGAHRLTETTYDPTLHTYPVAVVNPLGHTTATGYDFGLGLPISVTDPNSRTATTQYDGLGRVTAVTYPGYAQSNVQYVYPVPAGGVVAAPFAVRLEAWDELGPGGAQYRSAWTIYDGLGRALQAQGSDEAGTGLILTDTAYDARGLTVKTGRPRAASGSGGTYLAPSWASVPHTATTYDALGRVKTVTRPGGFVETTAYDGFRTTHTDANGHQTVREADAFGRLARVEEYTGTGPYTLYASTTYAYDRRDLLTGVTDALGNVTSISYDALGRKTAMTDPDMGAWGYVYDPLGNLTTQTDARGCTTTLAYDGLGRLTGKTYAGPGACGTTSAVAYTYDAGTDGVGRRTGMSDGSGSTAWAYNALGQVTGETRTVGGTAYTVGRTFDAFGRERTLTYPGGEVVTQTYNAMGALESVASSLGTTYATGVDYNAAGQVTALALGNGVTTSYAHNATTGRLESAGSAKVPQAPALDLAYTYDAAGNIMRIVDATRNETTDYAYDALDRLVNTSGSLNSTYGYNTIGNLTSAALPGAVESTAVAAPAAGYGHTCALTAASGAKCWGYNYYGQLGDGTSTQRLTPVDVSGLTSGVAALAADQYHTCALTTAGGVKCWGNTYDGQLGDGTTTKRTAPVDVSGLTGGVVAIAAGSGHTCALTAAGGVKCWGYNYYGQLGDGTSTQRLTPVDVSGLAGGVVAIAAGSYHTCALTAAGGAKCWGYNSYGQLGDWTTTRRTTPVNVSGLAGGVVSIAAGSYHTCALTAAGGAKCWGYNSYGQLGDGTTTQRLTPVNVSGLASGVVAVAGGFGHTCALTAAGGAKCWGYNYYGQLGDGTSTQRLTPVDVSGLAGGVAAVAYAYNDPAHAHAVTSLSTGESYGYDANGNMTSRVEGGLTYAQTFDAENRLVAVTVSGQTTQFVYDGDGRRVKETRPGGTYTVYLGDWYEVAYDVSGTPTGATSHYFAGGQRVAVRQSGALSYLLTDHLGSTSVTLDPAGTVVAEERFYPFGEVRDGAWSLATNFGFTGQRRLEGTGLLDYDARMYLPGIGRFVSPDTLVPDWTNPQDFNRYTYTRNNPLRYTDPTGHCLEPASFVACVAWAFSIGGLTLAVSQIPGDTAPHGQPGDPVVMAIGLSFASPVADTVFTLGDCLLNGCDPVTSLASIPVPGPSPSLAGRLNTADVSDANLPRLTRAQVAGADEWLPARDLRWTQSDVNWHTRAGVDLDMLADDISAGWRGSPLRVVRRDGAVYSLDNRRLTAAKLLDIDVPVAYQDIGNPRVATELNRKFTTGPGNGLSIAVRRPGDRRGGPFGMIVTNGTYRIRE